MSKHKVLMARREDPEVEAILKDAPSEVDIHFPAAGESLDAHLADAEIIYGGIREADLPKAKALRLGAGNLQQVSKVRCIPPSKQAM